MVIEIDGSGHVGQGRANSGRDAALSGSGFSVERFAGSGAVAEGGRLLSTLRAHAATAMREPADPSLVALLHAPSTPARLALAVIEAVVSGFLVPGRPWSMRVEDDLGIAPDLIGVALDPLHALSQLWDAGVVPDQVVVNQRTWRFGGGRAETGPSAGSEDVDVLIRLQPTTPYFAGLPQRGVVPEIVARGIGVPVDLAWYPPLTTSRAVIPKAREADEPLHLLLTDLFGHDGFRDGQLDALRQVLAGRDSVVLLPTGSGKSLIYQLGGLVTPGATVIVDPLVSLIDDQTQRLERDGIDRVASLHAGRMEEPSERDRVLGSMARGESLFVFATPERFQSARFRTHLASAVQHQLVGMVVIDEAHCVSEWGHDFRTSYLRLARTLRTRCVDRAGAPPPLLALTGTASPAVLRDVLRELEIDEQEDGALQRPADHDRPNLRYEKRVSDEQRWRADVRSTVLDRVPEYLGIAREGLVRNAGPATVSGVVFTPHVNGPYGAFEVAEELGKDFEQAGLTVEIVAYSGSARAGEEAGWTTVKADNVERFKSNQVPLLVGTKAFGMGIDKPNIRYTVHTGMPSSLEAFAQEAGRAGRNGDRALCTLVAILPGADVAEGLLDPTISPEDRATLTTRLRKDQGGDVKRQMFFLTNAFPGIDEELEAAIGVLRSSRWLGGVPAPGSEITLSLPWPRTGPGVDAKKEKRRVEDERRRLDRALYRLALAGIIDDLTTDGARMEVHVADWTPELLDASLLSYLTKIEPGRREAQQVLVASAPGEMDARIEHHLRVLIEATYSVVARARLQALRFMYETAAGPDDPDVIRARINSYLGGGPVAIALSEAARAPRVDVRRFIEVMSAIPAREQDDLVAQAERQLEAYPDHPLMLLASALGESRLAHADRGRFERSLANALAELTRYGASDADAALGLQWLAGLLRTEHGGRRREWQVDVLDAWARAGLSGDLVEPIESAVLEDTIRGRIGPGAATRVRDHRVRRHAKVIGTMADRLTSTDGDQEGDPS